MTAYDDPLLRAELDLMDRLCAEFSDAHRKRDPSMVMFCLGKVIAQAAVIWHMSPRGGVFDPAELFRRD